MSAFGKPPPLHLQGFDTSRSFSDPAFTYPAAPQPASQPPSQASPFQNATEIAQVSYGSHGTRGSYDEQAGPYATFNSNATSSSIRLTSRQPLRGHPGTKLDVYISSAYELMTTSLESIFLMFGPQKCQASLMRFAQQERDFQYIVSTDIPHLAVDGWESSEIPLFLLIENGDGELVEKLDVGPFTYDGDILKRGRLGSNAEELKSSERPPPLAMKSQEDFSTYPYLPGESYSSQMQFNPYDGMANQFGRGSSMYQPSPQGRSMYPYSTESPSSAIKALSQVPTWNSYRNNNPEGGQNQGTVGRTSLPSISPNPRLVRTSTMDQQRNLAGGSINSAGQAFYHQAMHPLAVILNFHNDLDAMGRTNTWSPSEMQSRRRILQFKRSQAGNTINIRIKPVSPEERQPSAVCISCILWEEKNQCFVTSVDTIQLLEHIMAQKFPTEEKNRIRRNLEHFKPLTIKKPIPDRFDETNSFFTTIMGFPQPKPRNIEKDIKVFSWKSLSNALKKITSKYSVSAGSLPQASLPPPSLTPSSSTGYSTESTTATYSHSNDRSGMFSPRSSTRSIPGASAPHSATFAGPSRINSPPYTHLNPIKGDLGQPGGPSDLRSASGLPLYADHNLHANAPSAWGAQHHMPAPHQQHQHQQQQYTPRASWDLSASAYSDPQGSASGAANIMQRTHQPLSPLRSRPIQGSLGGDTVGDQQGTKDEERRQLLHS